MASTTQAPVSQGKRGSVGSYTGGGNASLLIEKAKGGLRRSTPDSEALASSDDELDQRHHHFPSNQQPQPPRTTRRASWLSECQQGPPRKASLSGAYSTVGSNPTTPSSEPSAWPTSIGTSGASAAGRNHSNSASFPWGSAIWNTEAQKGPPSRLSEVLPSPTTIIPSGTSAFFGESSSTGTGGRRDSTTDSSIPFAIPLHPTPKTYRSQSYSVGQLDSDVTSAPSAQTQYMQAGRARAGSSYAGVPRRPSRPSMLNDLSYDNSVLEQLREVDDDEESASSSEAGVQLHTQQRTIEQLAMENAILRQQANQATAAIQMHNIATSNNPYPSNSMSSLTSRSALRSVPHRMSESVLEEPDDMLSGINDLGGQQSISQYGTIGRRYSDMNANLGSQYSHAGVAENRKIESVKKGHWQSSLGFGSLADIPQSRRHSFADVPTRHGSISSAGDAQNSQAVDSRGGTVVYNEGNVRQVKADSGEYEHFRFLHSLEEKKLQEEHLRAREFAASYFTNPNHEPASLRSPDHYRNDEPPSYLQQAYGSQPRAPSRGHAQVLYLVTFKACRAEFYYVQEGTGLQVKAGDLVIVEADRGTDLGTVAHENVDWSTAKEMKDYYVEEHYKWLMMFSRHGQSGTVPAANPNAASSMSGIGGMGPAGQGSSEPSEIKPKMIKRLAQSHEIQALKDKEGNEAKAKRMCQQKVTEHHLNMEILDAEFQMDWKKLTFYYFADSYINFNSLVTDLFKIYKTRIWMSAINPASFVTPSAGLQLPSGMGPGAVTLDRDGLPRSRAKRENVYMPSTTLSHMPQAAYEPAWGMPQSLDLSAALIPNAYSQFYQPQVLQHLNPNLHDYGRGLQQAMRSSSPFSSQAYGPYGVQQHPAYKPDVKGVAHRYVNGINDWNSSFQGLSLGS